MHRDEHGVWDGVLWDGRIVSLARTFTITVSRRLSKDSAESDAIAKLLASDQIWKF
jgi:hypothetical protein